MEHYDLVVLGTGPAGHHGAIQAAKLGKRVAAIEVHDRCGGVSATDGTIPSKALREATLHLTGLRERSFYGMNYQVKSNLTIKDLTVRTDLIIQNETSIHERQLRRNGVRLYNGRGSFISPQQIVVENREGGVQVLKAERILIAVGSTPAHPPDMNFDGERIFDSNQILQLRTLPKTLLVVGAGVIGIEYACIFSALGVSVTLINLSHEMLEFVDRQIVEVLKYHMQNSGMTFRLGEEVTGGD